MMIAEPHDFRAASAATPRHEYVLFLAVAIVASLLTVQREALIFLALLAAGLLLASYVLSTACLRTWPYLFISAAVVIPPLYPSFLGGNTPVYAANLLFAAGFFVMLARRAELQAGWDAIGKAAAGFLLAVALSLPFGFWLSGTSEGIGSCLRFLLLPHPFLIYYWLRGFRPACSERAFSVAGKFLLAVGAVAALYGIVDFYAPVPIPHPFADQYIYLDGRRIRRAQGLLYEASSFGNLSAFCLSLTLALVLSSWRRLSAAQKLALYLAAGIFTTALFLSYSRGSWANVFVTMTVFLALGGKRRLRLSVAAMLVVAGFVYLVYSVSPAVVTNFFHWRMGTLLEFWSDPNLATSGRWDNWWHLISFFADHPEYLMFGIGYKTLPHTHLFGRPIIADNGYLSLTFETGLIGLAAFLWLNRAILGAAYRRSQQKNPAAAVGSAFFFAFWCGQLVQMVTGDLFTYWRNMVVFFGALALVQNVPEDSPKQG
jgi:O-antigen ligase